MVRSSAVSSVTNCALPATAPLLSIWRKSSVMLSAIAALSLRMMALSQASERRVSSATSLLRSGGGAAVAQPTASSRATWAFRMPHAIAVLMATVKRATVALLLCIACSKQGAAPEAPDGGQPDGGEPGGGAPDSGIAYTPGFCADGGSPFDRSETFTSASGAPVTVTICGPQAGGAAATASSVADLVSATRDGGTGTLLLTPGT